MMETESALSTHDDLLAGLVDFHVHAAPDVRPRKCDAYELVTDAARRGLAAIVLKSHTSSWASTAGVLDRAVPAIRVVGGIALNHAVGGINPVAVEASLRSGGRIVWFPTHDATNEYRHLGRPPERGVAVLSDAGDLRSEVHDVIALCAEWEAVLCTGHLAPDEIVALQEAARQATVSRFVVTHPDHRHVDLPLGLQIELSRRGALMERIVPRSEISAIDLPEVAARIRATGAHANLLGSDLGQAHNVHPLDGFGQFVSALVHDGIARADIDLMGGKIPLSLLDR